MTQAEALQNAMDMLTAHRASLGEPTTITIDCGDAGQVTRSSGWSKSSINNGVQTVFLVVHDSPESDTALPSAKLIWFGKTAFVVSGVIEPPKDDGGYWLLPVREA